MANNNAPNGFLPTRRHDGAMWNDASTKRFIANAYATTLMRGDPVKTAATGYIQAAAAGNQISGIFWGCQYFDTVQQKMLFLPYYPASATAATGDITAFILDDPALELEAQLSGVITGFHAGVNLNFVANTNTTNFVAGSNASIDSASPATTATLPFRFVRFVERVDNDPTASFARAIVSMNNQDSRTNTGI